MKLQTIPRPGRLRAVGLAYWTQLRWWSWPLVLGLCGLGVWGASASWKPRTHNLPKVGHKKITEVGSDGREVNRYESFIERETPTVIFSSDLPSSPKPAPAAHVYLGDGGVVQGKEPQWDKLRSLTLSHGWASCQPLWMPGAMPLLESLVVSDQVQDASIVRLCELYDLKALVLDHAGDLTTTAMESLAREPRLEFLRLEVSQSSYDFPPLPGENPIAVQQRADKKAKTLRNAPMVAWPRTLKTLHFSDEPNRMSLHFSDEPRGTPAARLKEWQQLPQLRCLVTRLNPVEGNRLSDDVIASLKQFPQLKQLFLHEAAPGESELAIIQQRRLPHLSVRPWRYDPTRGRRMAVLLVSGLVVVLLLHHQLFKQFASTANRFKPEFAGSHLTFAAGVIAAMAVTSFLLHLLADCSWHAALGMCGAAVPLLAAVLKLFRLILGRASAMLMNNIGLQAQFLVVMVMVNPALVSLGGAELDWFLRGQLPWVTVCLLLAAVWGAFDWGTWLIGLSRDLEEAGCANVPLGTFDQKGWTEWNKNAAAVRTTGRERTPLHMRRQDRRLDQMVRDVAAGKKFTQQELWRLAVPMTWLDWVVLLMIILTTMLLPLGLLAYFLEGFSFEGADKFAWPLAFQIIVMGLLLPMIQLAQRHPMLPLERLHPATRADWTATWFRGVFREFAPITLLMFCGMLALQLSGWGFGESVFEAILAFIAFVGVSALIVSAGMFAMTLRSHWWLVMAIAVVSASVGLVSVMTDLNLLELGANRPLVAFLTGLLYVTAIWLWLAAKSRWREWELGLLEQ